MEISKKKFEDELNEVFLVFMGVPAILNCLAKGMWPIYYDCNKINVDVIFKLN